MNGKIAMALLLGLLCACAPTQPPAANAAAAPPATPAPAVESMPVDRFVSIRGASCEDLLRLAPDDRAAASMFYIGYLSSRFRAAAINVPSIPDIEVLAEAYCDEHPNRTAFQAFVDAERHLNPERPSAVLASNGTSHLIALRAAVSARLRRPSAIGSACSDAASGGRTAWAAGAA